MHDASTGMHHLDVARFGAAFIAKVVAMGDRALADKRHDFHLAMGMRVEAVWKPDGEREGSHEDIQYFRPTGEPDAPQASYINRL